MNALPGTQEAAVLSAEEQRRGRRLLLGFFSLNGIAVTCMMENVLLLWALRNGLSAPRVAVISSFLYLSMPFMLLGKRLSARWGLVQAWGFCWFVRYLFVLAMVPAPWLRGTRLEPYIPALITGCTFALFALRSMGMINTVPLMGALTDRRHMGSFQASVALRAHLSYFAGMLVVMALLRWRDQLGSYQLILTAGCLAGFLSLTILLRIPEAAGLRTGARMHLGSILRLAAGQTIFRRLAAAWCVAATATALIVPMAMLALKQGYGVGDGTALGFTLLEVAGAALAGTALAIIADHTGPRPLILLSMGFFCAVAGFWAFAPVAFLPAAVGAAFLVAGLSRGIVNIALGHYLLASAGARERIGIGMLMQMVSGLSSGLAGTVIGAGLLRLLAGPLGQGGLELYHGYYRVILLLSLLLFLVALRLPRLKDWGVREVIGLAFSFTEIRALIALNRLSEETTEEEEAARLDDLSVLASRHSEPVLLDFLEGGRLVPQSRALRALSRIPCGERTQQALIRLVREGAYMNGWRAAELLGQRRVAAAAPALREGLHSEDPFLRGKCMVALARLRDVSSYPLIRDLTEGADNPRILVHGANALEILRRPEDLPLLLRKGADRGWPQPVLDELLMAIAAIRGCKRDVYLLLKRLSAGIESPAADEPPREGFGRDPVFREFLGSHSWDGLPLRMRQVLRIMK